MYIDEEAFARFERCREGKLDCHTDDCDFAQMVRCIWTDAWNDGYETCSSEEDDEQ